MVTDSQIKRLISASVLLGSYGLVLSEFEQRLVAEVGVRFTAFKRDTVVTDLEQQVIDDACEAMRRKAMSDMSVDRIAEALRLLRDA